MHLYTVTAAELKQNNMGVPCWTIVEKSFDSFFLATDMESAKGHILSLLPDKPRFHITKEPEWKAVKLEPTDDDKEAMDWIQRLEDRMWYVEINEREYMEEMLEIDSQLALDFLIQLWKRHSDDKVITRR